MDCLSVINMLRHDPQPHHKHTHSGYARFALGEDGSKLITGVYKVKARQDILGGGLEGRELARARVNDAADVAAKLGARCHGCPDEDLLAEVQQLVALSKEILVLAARLLPLWPSSKGLKAPRVAARAPGQKVRACGGITLHQWEFMGCVWHCTVCSSMACADKRVVARARERCPGFNKWIRALLLDQRGHQLAVGDADGLALLACVACGCGATTKPVGLLEVCTGVPTVAGRTALRRLGRGLHPVELTPLEGMWSLSRAEAMAFEGGLAEDIEAELAPGPRSVEVGVLIAQERLEALRVRVLNSSG